MIKKIFSAILLVVAFLLLNLGFNPISIHAEELPGEIFANAGWGEKKNYWAIVNYGADYIGSTEVTIDIQQEAIADHSVNSIAIVESGYSLVDLVHYERNKDLEFGSKITYNLKNTRYEKKFITVLLLTEFSMNPSEAAIVDKITIGVDQKRPLNQLDKDDILVIKENETIGASPYKINVTLPPEIEGKGKLEDYVFKSVTYTLQGETDDEDVTINAMYESLNNFAFTVRQNGTYLIEVEDVFGYKIQKEIVVDNLRDPDIVIETYPQIEGPTNLEYYMIDVRVKYYDTGYVLTSGDLKVLDVTYNRDDNTTHSILASQQIKVLENGIYTIKAESLNGSLAELEILVENIDREDPFVQVLDMMEVYTEAVDLFNPAAQIFAYDTVTESTQLIVTWTYHKVAINIDADGNYEVGSSLEESEYRGYLYTVRDIVIRYRVEDEAGNSVVVDSYVKSLDNTAPVIRKTILRTDFYINDPYPTGEEIEERYGIVVEDNSIYDEYCGRTYEYYLDFSRLPVDANFRLNVLGEYNIFVRAIDESGNVSEHISLIAEVRARRIHVEAGEIDENGNVILDSLYVIYGDEANVSEIEIPYHCVTRDGDNVPCKEELLEGDFISGQLYILNAHYVGIYTIYYNNLRVPSDLYYLHYEEGATFEIKPRTIKVVLNDDNNDGIIEKYYLDEDPVFTYRVDTRVCDITSEYYNKDYRCTFAPNTGDKLMGAPQRYMGEPDGGIDVWMDEGSWSVSEAVWYDSNGLLVTRPITIGTLEVYEQYDSGVDNYYLDFEEAEFLIKPKHISVYIKSASKIYGENDEAFEIEECRGDYPINGATLEYCSQELRLSVERVVEGETVKVDASGNYIDYYLITGNAGNKNYQVLFYDAYLTILRRDVSLSIKGDIDEFGNNTGKYTIYYEDDIPQVEVYDSSSGEKTGLVKNVSLDIEDKISQGRTAIYTQDHKLVVGYVNGIGVYIIDRISGASLIENKYGEDAEYNYNVTFNPGQLEVIKKDIWVKIIRDLSKVYGDNDRKFTEENLEPYDEYVILEANGRFIIEITPTELDGGEPYIPRDNDKMKYHLKRKDGIDVGKYLIEIEKLEGCENYDVYLFDEYQYEIVQRDLYIDIEDQVIVYRELANAFEWKEGVLVGEERISSLQYNDKIVGSPSVEEYKNVGKYVIGIGDLHVVDPNRKDGENDKDVSFNYNFIVTDGILEIIQREVTVEVSPDQKKQYGEFDPDLEFVVYYQGRIEDMPEEDYSGKLGREPGEVPDQYYEINWGTFKIELNGLINDVRVGNYLITEFKNNHKFYIEKRTIHVKARDVTAIYRNDYSESIKRDTNGGLAYNLSLTIDGYPIQDQLEGELKIIGNVDGVGKYTISCEDLKIVRYYTGEDVTTKYYNYTYENGTLEIVPRTIKITPLDGQYKTYGDKDEDGINFTYTPELLEGEDEWVGELKREPLLVNGSYVTEEVGQYNIGLGTLAIKTKSGKENYELVLDGIKTYTINYRTLTLQAKDLEIEYGDSYKLEYEIIDGSLANNPEIGIVDTITGELNLDRAYEGVGTYQIRGDNLVVSNVRNYKYTFLTGVFIVKKKVLTITPSEETLYKIYGEKDPDYFKFTTNIPGAIYSGVLSRDEGENVGKYRIRMGTLDFGPNYDVYLDEAFFTIGARIIEVKAENSGKLYGTKDPQLVYYYIGTLVGNDRFYGSLVRDAGEEVGDYDILQGSLSINSNYKIEYTPGVFSIRYAEFTGLTIYSVYNNQYQIKGAESEVRLYVRFNEGADESDIKNVEWSMKKNDVLVTDDDPFHLSKDTVNNIVSFLPSGSLGTYVISATYKGVTATYEVYVELSTVGEVYIRWDSGSTEQTLGKEEPITYYVIVPENADPSATVQWLINGTTVRTNPISNIYFVYTPNLGKGEYTVQARISGVTSEPLTFVVRNNNPPVITLNGSPVVYIEAKTGANYIEEYATVWDDIDKDITDSLVVTGYVNCDIKGTYYIKYDAKDSHGNNAISVYRQVVVRDTTPPVVTLIGNKEMKLLYGQEYIEYGATAMDNYDGKVEVTINNPIVANRIGRYEVTYIAYDSSGNRGTAVRYVEVINNVSPVITLIGNEITYVEVYGEFKDEGALIEDNVDGRFVMPATSFFYGTERVDRIDTSVLGTYYAHYDYQDTAGNIGAGKVRIVIVRDSTPPQIILNGTNPYIVRYSYPEINYKEPGAVAKDNYDEFVPVTITGEIGSELGSYFIYYNAVDSHGNIAETVTREVIVIDVQNPIIYFYPECPQYMTIEALYETYDKRCDMPGYGFWVDDDYKADLEELQKRVVITGTVDDTTVGIYTIKYDVKDMSGNSAVTLTRYVEVVDTTAPVITLKCEEDKVCDGDTSQIVEVFNPYQELGAIVYDRYDLHHNIETKLIINHNINVNKLGEYTVIYNATDSNGNKAEPVIRIVYVKDTTPPEITIIGDNPMIIERGMPYIEYEATVIDNYDGPIEFKYVTIIGAPSGMSLGEYDVIYKVSDSSGNIGEAIRKVHVVDTIPPIVLGVEDGKYYREPVSIYFIPTLGTDEVLHGWLNDIEITSPYFVEDEGVYDLRVVDDAGNETKIWFAIDSTPPLILGVKNGEYTNREVVEVYSNEKIKYYEYRYQSGEWVRTEDQTVSFTIEGVYRIYAVDMADNVSDMVMFTIDRTAPNYSLIGVLNKGITNTDVNLITETEATVVVNALYNIPTLYTFTDDGYYQVVIRDLAGNTVNLQFVINKTYDVIVDSKLIRIISQHNAINQVSISGKSYARNNGVMIAMPLIEGGFKYVSGKLFSESEYQTLMSGGTVEIRVAGTDDTYMFVGFVVTSEELNKFGSQTVEGDSDDDSSMGYAGIAALAIALILFLFIFFLRRRKKQEDEEEETEETIYEDY